MVLLNLAAVVYPLKIHQLSSQHCWFSGRMLACHAGGPGSIPGQCRILNFWILTLLTKCFSLPCSYGRFHGVMVRLVQPIRSAEPLHRPNCTGRPFLSSSVPVLLRNKWQSPLLHASRICCWMVCSLAAAGIHNVFGPRYRVLISTALT